MKVLDLMTRDVYACSPESTLAQAAQIMWDHDLGALPVTDDRNRLIGMITDRDICMAAYTRGQTLRDMIVGEAMSTKVVTCAQDATDLDVARAMATRQIRRIPVVDADERVVGIVTVNDLALAMQRDHSIPAREVAETVAAVCSPRRSGAALA
jgi:CBS domain-containing protein